jgi:uncharacterized membrane protein
MSRVERDILVEAPADTVYQVWRNVENLPNFMSGVTEVQETSRGRTHWRRAHALRNDEEWDAEITSDDPAHAISWRTLGDGHTSEARVEFESLGDATRVRYAVECPDPGGVEKIASLFSSDEARVEQDLQRFKEIVESAGYMRATERIANVNTTEAP